MVTYNSDKPIKTENEDKLDRALFSDTLAESIIRYKEQSGLVIGLFGEWGSGKTSIINMAKNKLEEDGLPIVEFSPWSYSDRNDLIGLFFNDLIRTIENKKISGGRKLLKQIKLYATFFSPVLDYLSSQRPTIGTLAKVIIKFKTKDAGLVKIKNDLEEKLEMIDKKIVVIIDDIDRLDNSQIKDIFQLVKQVADFPNIVYILSMDKKIVSKSLDDIYGSNGDKYIEKIIQVPFEVPMINKYRLHNLLSDEVNKIINDPNIQVDSNSNRRNIVLKDCITPYINNVRNIKRLFNSFQLRYIALSKETCFEDLLAITAIEIFDPALYKWIIDNKSIVCENIDMINLIDANKLFDPPKFEPEKLSYITTNTDQAIKCLSTLFPKIKDSGRHSLDLDDEKRLRIANSEKFNTYFALSLDNIKIPSDTIHDCLYKLDKKALSTHITGFIEDGYFNYFINEVKLLVNKIPKDRLGLIGSALSNSYIHLNVLSQNLVYNVVRDILEIISEEKRYKFISSELKNNKDSLGLMADFTYEIEAAYGRISYENIRERNRLVSEENLNKLEKIYLRKINEIVSASELTLDTPNFIYIIRLWQLLDKKKCVSYMKRLLSDDTDKLKFACFFISMHTRWDPSINNYKEIITPKEIENIMQNIHKNKLLSLPEDDQLILASLTLNRSEISVAKVKESAKKVVLGWKQSIK